MTNQQNLSRQGISRKTLSTSEKMVSFNSAPKIVPKRNRKLDYKNRATKLNLTNLV